MSAPTKTPTFTPGPWRPSIRPDGSASVQSDDWGPIAEVHVSTKPMPGEVAANARLIASAPALHAALQAQEEAEQARLRYVEASKRPHRIAHNIATWDECTKKQDEADKLRRAALTGEAGEKSPI